MNVGSLLRGHILWRGLAVVTSFITTVVLSRYLEAAMTGWFFYVLAWLSFFVLIGSMGMDSAITFIVSKGKADMPSLFTSTITWILFCLLASGLTEYTLISRGTNAHANILPGSYTLFIGGNLLLLFFSAFFYAKKKFIIPSFFQISGNILFSAYCIFYSESHSGDSSINIHHIILVYTLFIFLQGLSLFIYFIYTFFKELKIKQPSVSQLKFLLSYSGLTLISNLLFFVYQRADYWMIRNAGLSDFDLGNYIQASRIAQLFQVLPVMIAGALFPILSSMKENKMQVFLPLLRLNLQLNMLLLAFIALTGQFLFPFLFGSSFMKTYQCFLFLIPGILSLTILSFLSAFFASENRLYVNFMEAGLALAVLVSGNVLFLKKYGLYAAPVINSISALLALPLTIMIFKRVIGIGWKGIFLPVKNDYKHVRNLVAGIIIKQ